MKLFTIITCLLLSFTTFSKDILLTSKNHVLLRGNVDGGSIAEVSSKLLKLSSQLPETEIIYLIIDSDGGSVFAGIDLINVMEIIPQQIHTISLYAFSMAYSISQRGEKRYIAQRGIMGQHRAKGEFKGQFAYGEVEKQLEIITKVILDIESYEAKKIGVTLKEFQALIKDEMYVYYTDAVEKKVADDVAQVNCSKKLVREFVIKQVCGFFGCMDKRYSKCPIIRGELPVVKNKKVTEEEE